MNESLGSFLPESLQAPLSSEQAVKKEFLDDAPSYAPEAVNIIKKFYIQGLPLTPQEDSIFSSTRSAWWKGKYGFDFIQAKERNALLERKYSISNEVELKHALFEKLLSVVESGDVNALIAVKKAYLDRYPDQLEGVTTLLDFPSQMDRQAYLNSHSFKDEDPTIKEETLRCVEECTQYTFLLSHFVLENTDDKIFLEKFWSAIENMAQKKGKLEMAHKIRRATLSQIATHKIFAQLGLRPKLSHPKEDAFKKVDLWVDGSSAIQVKGTNKAREEMFMESKLANFPGIQIETEKEVAHYNSHFMREMAQFGLKLSEYQKEIEKPLKGYFVVVPYHEFDFVTGDPSEAIVRRFASHLDISHEPGSINHKRKTKEPTHQEEAIANLRKQLGLKP